MPTRTTGIRQVAWVAALVGPAVLAGCADTVGIIPGIPRVPVPDILRVVKDVDRPDNLIERGLSECERGRTPAGETACLKDTLAAAHLSVPDLIAIVPGCRDGTVCHYRFTTVDRVGFVPATQSDYRVRWQVDFDLRKPVKAVPDVPITVAVT